MLLLQSSFIHLMVMVKYLLQDTFEHLFPNASAEVVDLFWLCPSFPILA